MGSSRLRAGWTQTDRRMDVTHLTSGRHQSPLHTTGHVLASKPAFDLEFLIYRYNHGEKEEAQQVISWQGEKKSFGMWHFCSALKAESAWRYACAKSMAFHIKPSRKKKPKPILQTLVDGKAMEELQLQHNGALSHLLLTCHFGSVLKRKKYESNHLNIILSQRKIIPYSLGK